MPTYSNNIRQFKVGKPQWCHVGIPLTNFISFGGPMNWEVNGCDLFGYDIVSTCNSKPSLNQHHLMRRSPESCQSECDFSSSYHLFPTYKISKQRRQDSIQYQYIVTSCKLTCPAWRSYSSIALCFLRHLPSNMIQLHKFGTIHVQGAHSRGNRSHIILFWVMTDVEHLEAKRSVTWQVHE